LHPLIGQRGEILALLLAAAALAPGALAATPPLAIEWVSCAETGLQFRMPEQTLQSNARACPEGQSTATSSRTSPIKTL
jgi:hypothetical protein